MRAVVAADRRSRSGIGGYGCFAGGIPDDSRRRSGIRGYSCFSCCRRFAFLLTALLSFALTLQTTPARSQLSGAFKELVTLCGRDPPGLRRQFLPGDPTGHVLRQHHGPIGMLAVEHNDEMLYAKRLGHILGFDPNEELCVSSSNNGGLGLNAKTPFFKILELLNEKPGFARDERNQALSGLFRRLVQVFRYFQDGVCRHTDATVIQKRDFQFARFFRLPSVVKINRVACFRSHPG